MKKNIVSLQTLVLLICAGFIFLAACSEPPELTQERLDAMNCQTGDLPKNQTYQAVEAQLPTSENYLTSAPILISSVAWNDISSSRQTFRCTIFVFSDAQAAGEGFQRACDQLYPPFRFPKFADSTCRTGDQEVNFIFRKNAFVVWLWVDYKGVGVEDAASRVLERLEK